MTDPKVIRANVERMVAKNVPEDVIEEYIQAAKSEATAKPKSRAGAFLAPIAQGLTLGASDEILGGLEGLSNLGKPGGFSAGYQRGKETIRAGGKEYASAHPVASPVLELVAGIGTPGFGVAKFAGKAASLGGKVTRSMLAGAATGGVGGAAYSTEGGRLAGAGLGAGIGAGVGALLPVAGKLGGELLNEWGARGAKGIERQGLLKIAEAAKRSGKTAEQVLGEGEAFARAGKPSILADHLGENGLGVARGIVTQPGKFKQTLPDFYNERQSGQFDRIMGNIEDRVGMKGRDVYDVAEEQIAARKAAADPAYAAVRHLPINSPETQAEIVELMGVPVFKDAMKRGAGLAAAERNPMVGDTPLTVGDIDYMKQGLDAIIHSKGESGASISRNEARVYRGRLNELLDMVDKEHEGYAVARSEFAGHSRLTESLEEGRNFLKEPHQVTDRQLASKSPGEQDMYRIGALGALRSLGEGTPEHLDLVKKMAGNKAMKNRLSSLLADSEKFAGLSDDLAKEGMLFKNQTGVMVGSRTAPVLAEQADVGSQVLQAALNMGTGNIGGLVAQGAKAGVRGRLTRGNEKIRDATGAKLLTKAGTPEFKALLAEAAKLMDPKTRAKTPVVFPVDRLMNRITGRKP